MTEIAMRHLSPIVLIDPTTSVSTILGRLGDMSERDRRSSVVVVGADDGQFATFTYQDLLERLAEDESRAGLEVGELLETVGAVSADTVDRFEYSIGDARDVQRDAPGSRLVVLEDAVPVGVLIGETRGGASEAVQQLEQRIFEAKAAMEGGQRAEPPAEGPTPRWLSARVHADGEQRRRAFKSGATNVLTIGVAPADTDYIQSDEEFPHEVPEGEVHTMDVDVWAPGLLDAPLRGQFDVPHAGSSVEPATFNVPVPVGIKRVEINVEVTYKGRMVQGATLMGDAVPGADTDASDAAAIEFRRAVATGLDPAVARGFAATLVMRGESILIATGGGKTTERDLGGIKEAAKKIGDRLYASAVAEAHAEEEGGQGEAVRKLLTFLAYQGRAIFNELVATDSAISGARTIEVTLRDPSAFLPIEFVYERPSPGENPAVCPNWAAAFRAGETACPDCPAVEDAGFVCPLGFWGLSREIARRIDPIVVDEAARSAVTSNPSVANSRLARFGGVVIGASSKVDAADEASSQIGQTVDVATKLLGEANVRRVEDWPGWVTAVQERAPSVLLAMSHTEIDDEIGAEVLQIGAASNLRSLSVGGQHVQLPIGKVGPIVLLLGCTTAQPEIGYLGFVPAFLNHHAAVVVGTVAKVLGRHTGPVARQFLEAVVAAQGKDLTLGEVLRRTRGDMLLANNPMGMTLAAYGNSDWLLAAAA